jgi:hypothetical protein
MEVAASHSRTRITSHALKRLLIVSCGVVAGCGVNTSTSGNSTHKSEPTVQATPAPTGSNLGYLWLCSDSTLRPIVGVPGSAHIDSPVLSDHVYTTAAVALRAQVALLEDNAGNLAVLQLNRGQEPETVASGLPQGQQIGFAPAGRQAVAFVPGTKSIIRITGLPGQPQSSSLAGSGVGSLSAVALSDTGMLLLSYQLEDGTTSIVVIGAESAPTQLLALAHFGGMTFLSGGNDALISDSAKNALYLVHSVGPSATVEPLASAKDGLNEPNRVAASYDGHWAIVSNQGDSSLVRIDVTGATGAMRVSCSCIPTQLTPLAGNAVFQLTGPDNSPAWIVDASAILPKVYFIPQLPSRAQGTAK